MADPTRRPLVAGNWKMNGLKASAAELGKIMAGAGDLWTKADLMICPPATLIMTFAQRCRAAPGSRSAARIAMPSRPAPSPATFRPRCWRTSAPRR